MKLEKLLCLKYLGSRSREKSGGFHTTKLAPPGPHDTTRLVAGSSTISYVLIRNGAGESEAPCGCGCEPPSMSISMSVDRPSSARKSSTGLDWIRCRSLFT